MRYCGWKLQCEEAKVVQRVTHILEGKKESLTKSEKGNVMEGKETLVEGKKKSSVMGENDFGGMEKKSLELGGGEEG